MSFFFFFCLSWFTIWWNSVITQDVPWSSEAWNSIWTKPVSAAVGTDLKRFVSVSATTSGQLLVLHCFPVSPSNLCTSSSVKRTWYHTRQNYWSVLSGSSTTIRLCQECEESTLPPLDWSRPAWWVTILTSISRRVSSESWHFFFFFFFKKKQCCIFTSFFFSFLKNQFLSFFCLFVLF